MRSGCNFATGAAVSSQKCLGPGVKDAVKALRHCVPRAINQSGAVFGCLQNPRLWELHRDIVERPQLSLCTIAATTYQQISSKMMRTAIADL